VEALQTGDKLFTVTVDSNLSSATTGNTLTVSVSTAVDVATTEVTDDTVESNLAAVTVVTLPVTVWVTVSADIVAALTVSHLPLSFSTTLSLLTVATHASSEVRLNKNLLLSLLLQVLLSA